MDFFGRRLKQVGSLPNLPVFVDFAAPPRWVPLSVEEVGPSRFAQVLDPPRISSNELVYVDAYALREAFDSVTTPTEMKAFLERCGPFRDISSELVEENTDDDGNIRVVVGFDQFVGWQEYLKNVRLHGFERHVYLPEAVSKREFEFFVGSGNWTVRSATPSGKAAASAYVECASALEALIGTAAVDQASSVEWRECGYEHCKTPQKLFRLDRKGIEKLHCDRVCKEAHQKQRKRVRDRQKTKGLK